MTLNNPLQTGVAVRRSEIDIEACLTGKAYIAVLKHRLTNGAPDRTFKEIFDEAYRTASHGTKEIPIMTTAPRPDSSSGSLDEQIEPFIAGKAYIAVLKHQLAHGSTGRSALEVFDEAYRTAAGMARSDSSPAAGEDRLK